MPEITLDTLKTLWKKEKDSYLGQELGTGVHTFVYKIFECVDLFNLNEGKLSTPDNKRKNEFLKEAKKKGRRADVVIFIDSDIIIPVEVEKHGNIKAGITQIFNYQTDWNKKYGILTDGNEWRFYNNTIIERIFFIDKVLENPTDFLTYWKGYVTPEYYYLSFFEKKGQQELFKEYIPNLDEVRQDFFRDITELIKNFENKLNLEGYFKDVEDKTERKKKAIEITYAYLIQFILYKVLVDNDFADFQDDWKNRLSSIHNALKAGAYGEVLDKIKRISQKISEKIYKPFNDEQENINKRLEEILNKPKQDISDVSVWLDILLFINRYDFVNIKNEIFGYVYENYLKQFYEDEGKKGQYFTDPNVVEFMLNEMGYTKENLKKRHTKEKDNISIIDPSCGSGTFLYNATARLVNTFFDNSQSSAKQTEQIINDNVFGLDIAEFPLYLAEMNILMRMLPVIITEKYNNPVEQKIKMFKTRDSIYEFRDTSIAITLTDIAIELKKNKGQVSLDFARELDLGYKSFMRDKGDLNNLKESLENKNKIPRYRFDFVIGNPPYVSYNECAAQHLLFFEKMKENRVKLSDVYGINLHSVEENRKKYPPKPNLYAFFIALGLALLKDDGKICYIIPQTLLTESDYDVLRYHLANFTTIEKIFTFENPLFIGRGIKQGNKVATSSLIFVIKKALPTNAHKVQIYNYNEPKEQIADILKNIKKPQHANITEIKQGILLKNYLNWIIIKLDKDFIELYDEYRLENESIAIYSEHTLAVPKFKSEFYFDVGFILDKSKYLKNSEKGDEFEIIELNNFTGYSHYKPTTFYPNDIKKIELPKNSQGHITLTKKYKIIWGKVYSNRFYFTDRKLLPSMSFTQFISSNNKTEMLYLLSLFNAKLNNFIFNKLFRLGNEKYGIFVVVKRIKEFVKVPIITKENEHIKSEIISQIEKMLEMEKQIFADLVDFKNVLLLKFDNAEVIGNNLIFNYKDNSAKCKILSHPKLVEQAIYNIGQGKMFNIKEISITELKNTTVFDRQLQQQIKNYIDDLVFALYFKVKLSKLGFQNREAIKDACSKNKFYKLLNS